MLKTLRYNLRYILLTSNKIATIVFSLWGFITLVTPTDGILDAIKNGFLRIIVAALILIIIYIQEFSQKLDLKFLVYLEL